MKKYEVGIVYRFWADDEDHAKEQFVNAVDGQPHEAFIGFTARLLGEINWMHILPPTDVESSAHCPECGRVFDLMVELDAQEWFYGHDCEVD